MAPLGLQREVLRDETNTAAPEPRGEAGGGNGDSPLPDPSNPKTARKRRRKTEGPNAGNEVARSTRP
eukprot:2872792-Lingulodinium_polyedra.AAC.1